MNYCKRCEDLGGYCRYIDCPRADEYVCAVKLFANEVTYTGFVVTHRPDCPQGPVPSEVFEDIPRPDGTAELAQLVAAELRDRGFRAKVRHDDAIMLPIFDEGPDGETLCRYNSTMLTVATFENLNPREIANVIQAEERRRAREWAGDK